MNKVMQLCLRSIIQHVAGDTELAKKYETMAMDERVKRDSIISIGETISKDIQKELYKLVG